MGRAGSRIAFRFWSVLVLALSLSVLSSYSWGACHDNGTGVYNGSGNGLSAWLGDCGGDPSSCCLYGFNGYSYGTLCSVGSRWQNSSITCDYSQNGNNFSISYSCIWCDTQAEADSVRCLNSNGHWYNRQCFNCAADEEWDGTHCVKPGPENCTDAACCMAFNEGNVPVDSGFVGCIPPADGSQSCVVSGSSAVCNGQSVYSLCTQQYLWNKSTKQCAPVTTNNCIEVIRTDDMCTDVTCNSYTETQVVGMTFNPSTRCYEGKYREITHMECSNGNRGEVSQGPLQDYVVCESYLDSLGAHIEESSGNPTDISITDYVSGQYPGGPSVDAQGNTVDNSPGGQTGGTSTTNQEVVTRDSSGNTVIVKASDGSDSTQLVTSFSSVRCLGCSNGYCTLTNGSSNWTCSANSCSQALMSYNMNGGVCSANYNEYYNQPQGVSNNFFNGDTASKMALTDSVIDYTAQLNRINKNLESFILGNGSPVGFFEGLEAVMAVVENTTARQLASDTALTRLIMVKMDSMQSAINLALNLHAGRMEDALGSASSQISGLFDEQNNIITSASSQASGSIVAAIHGNTSAVNSASSQNLVVMQNLMSVMGENTQVINSVDSKVGTIVNQLSQANDMRYNFYAYMHDTLQTDLGITISGALNYNSDNIIVPAIESQTSAIVDAIGEISVDVNDSVFYKVKQSVDSLRDELRGYMTPETIDDTGSTVYDGVLSDSAGSGWLSSVDSFESASVSDSAFQDVFPVIDTVSDTAWVPDADSLGQVLRDDVDSSRSAIEGQLQDAFDSLKDDIMLINFDSAIIAPLGLRVPNTNTCPAHCFTFTIEGSSGGERQSWLGGVGTIDFGLCNNLPGMNFDVFILIRLIARILVAVACVYIGLWFIAGRKV